MLSVLCEQKDQIVTITMNCPDAIAKTASASTE